MNILWPINIWIIRLIPFLLLLFCDKINGGRIGGRRTRHIAVTVSIEHINNN